MKRNRQSTIFVAANLHPLPFLAALAGASALAAAAHADPAPSLSATRWAEDWRGATDAPAYKDIQLGHGVSLDFGTDLRWKFETIDNPRFNMSASQSDDSWLQQRLLGHANLRFGDWMRVFAQVGAFDVIGKDARGSSDDDRVDLTQAFVDFTPGGGDAMLRLGRQELAYGGNRFFIYSDTSNIRPRYNAARFDLTLGPWSFSAAAGEPIANEVGAWDDDPQRDQDIVALQAERDFGDVSASGFLIDFARDDFTIAGTTANDRRLTAGVNVVGKAGPYKFDAEIVHQSGDFGTQDVDAWGGALELSRGFSGGWSPRAGLRLTYGSGDSDPTDDAQETYAPPFPRNTWFSEGGFTSHGNIIEFAPTLALKPAHDMSLNLKLSGLWRAEDSDFIYVASQTPLAGTRGGDDFIGVSPYLQAIWRPTPNIELRGQAVYFDAGDRIEDLGGEDAAYGNFSVAFRY